MLYLKHCLLESNWGKHSTLFYKSDADDICGFPKRMLYYIRLYIDLKLFLFIK